LLFLPPEEAEGAAHEIDTALPAYERLLGDIDKLILGRAALDAETDLLRISAQEQKALDPGLVQGFGEFGLGERGATVLCEQVE
jgi:hypothetical protein